MERGRKKKHSKYEKYIKDVNQTSGIYAITIDNWVVYIGRSKTMRSRVRRNIRNAFKNHQRDKYRLLTATLRSEYADKVKCVELKKCPIEELDLQEKKFIRMCKYLPLNTYLSHSSPVPNELTFEGFIANLYRCNIWSTDLRMILNKSQILID